MGESVDTSKITNVLIFKDGYYYLTVKIIVDGGKYAIDTYTIAPDEMAVYNGFEFASDAYAYLADLKDGKTGNEKT